MSQTGSYSGRRKAMTQQLEKSNLQYTEWKEDNGKVIFQTRAKVMSAIYALRIDKAFGYNLISTYMVEKLNLPCVEHIEPYMLKGVKVDKRVFLPLFIGRYEDVIWCDVIPMNSFHILLGWPWYVYRSASYSIEKNRYSFEINGKKLILGPLTPSQICEDEKIVKKNMKKYEREKNERSKGVHVDIPREEKGEVVLSEMSGMSSEVKSDIERKEKREGNEMNKVCEVERENQEGLSESKEKLFSERKEAKGEENVSLVIKAKVSVSKKKVSLLPNPLTLSYFSSCDFVQPRVEIPFERGGEAQEMVAKDLIGFQHEFGDIYSCWMVEDKSLIKFFVIEPFDYFHSYLQCYDMEFPKSIAKLEPLHKRIQGDDVPLVNKSKYGMYNWFICILDLSRTPKVFLEVMNYTLISYIGDFIIFVDDDILMHIKSLTVISKLKCKSNFLPFEIVYDIDDYVFQLGGKRHEIYEKKLVNELNISSSLIQVANEFSCDKLLECDFCCVMGSHSSSHVQCELIKVFVTSKDDMHDYCNTCDQILFHVEESMRFLIVDSWLYHESIFFDTCGRDTYIKWMCGQSFIISLSCIPMDYLTDKIELQVLLHGASTRGFYCIDLGRRKFCWDDDIHMLYLYLLGLIGLNGHMVTILFYSY
ncbi:uncharacterized protein LOC142180359 [Nicotiana tabacum]|uniref:Uncharacterized protein LOC142180359 n=1 Tax=Nicotiana tabacum TaxID=4097 RepID=A0AC58UG39_TOBAC